MRKLLSPVAVWTSERIAKKKTSPDPGFVKRANELINPDNLYRGKNKASVVDLGVVKVYEGNGFEYVKVPFVEIIGTPAGEEVKVGPMRFHDGRVWKLRGEMLTVRELTNGFQHGGVHDRGFRGQGDLQERR